jgi:choline kinase
MLNRYVVVMLACGWSADNLYMEKMNIVILAAGLGSRLGGKVPKPLTVLADGRTIMEQQISNLRQVFGEKTEISIVVGYKADLIVEAQPDCLFVYNEKYDVTNTSKSLLRALNTMPKNSSVLWLNGDVVFDAGLLELAKPLIEADQSFISVNNNRVSDEEIKYTTDPLGYILDLSKTVPLSLALGEAMGINFVSSSEVSSLISHLRKVADGDYFEKAIENGISTGELLFTPHNLTHSGFEAMEIDFQADLQEVNRRMVHSSL